MSTGHQSPQSTLPPLKYKTLNTTTWGAGGNTCTITDAYIVSNSYVDVYVTGTTPQAGQWSYTITPTSTSNGTTTAGTLVITSSNSESSTLPITYVII